MSLSFTIMKDNNITCFSLVLNISPHYIFSVGKVNSARKFFTDLAQQRESSACFSIFLKKRSLCKIYVCACVCTCTGMILGDSLEERKLK